MQRWLAREKEMQETFDGVQGRVPMRDQVSNFVTDAPAVREAIANVLLQNGDKPAPAQLAQMVDNAVPGLQRAQTFTQAYEGARRGVLANHAGQALLALAPWANEKPERRLGRSTYRQ